LSFIFRFRIARTLKRCLSTLTGSFYPTTAGPIPDSGLSEVAHVRIGDATRHRIWSRIVCWGDALLNDNTVAAKILQPWRLREKKCPIRDAVNDISAVLDPVFIPKDVWLLLKQMPEGMCPPG
jgi:hypothetical protein